MITTCRFWRSMANRLPGGGWGDCFDQLGCYQRAKILRQLVVRLEVVMHRIGEFAFHGIGARRAGWRGGEEVFDSFQAGTWSGYRRGNGGSFGAHSPAVRDPPFRWFRCFP